MSRRVRRCRPERRSFDRRADVRVAGMTLLEVLIALVVVSLIMTGVVMGARAVNKSDLRTACSRIVSASRFAYGRAVTRGHTVRLQFDFKNGTMAVEESDLDVTLRNPDDDEASDEEEASDVVDPWAAAEARISKTYDGLGHQSPFSAVTGRNGKARKKYEARPLASGIVIRKLIVPHEPVPRTDGAGAVYFFPGGMGERAVIQLAQGDTVYSVAIHPLTGAARVYNYAYEPEDISASDLEDT